jgi:DNA-binding transcriptional MocR family regulator
MSTFEYMKLADAVAADIGEGRLKAGDRLPPQRTFAYDRKIAVSTASRVYTELLRRGLVVGEVGRGTFVSGETRRGIAAATEPGNARIDLEFNYPILPAQFDLIARSFSGLLRPENFQTALKQSTTTATSAFREIAARFLARDDWKPNPDELVFTGNGRQCAAAALAALVPPGGRCGVEALTYPFVKSVAARLGISLVPLAMDEAGVRPDAIEKAHREAKLSALYLQPTIHNPLGITMPTTRRKEVARLLEKLDLVVIEDAIYGFLSDQVPLAAFAPKFCVLLDSLSKRVAPGLTLGFIVSPMHLRETIAASVRSGGWTGSGYAFAAGRLLMSDGTASEIAKLKRADAQQRQRIAAKHLSGFEVTANDKAYHLWLTLPPRWRSQSFVAAAARRDIALTPSSTFAISPGHAPNAIRLALASPAYDRLEEALQSVAHMLNADEDNFHLTE